MLELLKLFNLFCQFLKINLFVHFIYLRENKQ